MEDRHRDSIQRNFVSLVEQTDLDTMVTLLYEKGVFSEAMIEPYKDTNKDVRHRKRSLYRDIMRRGPHAFGHLVDTLTEAGYWDLVRDLDPNSSLHLRPQRSTYIPKPQEDENSFVSLSRKKKTKPVMPTQPVTPVYPTNPVNSGNNASNIPDDVPEDVETFHVVKSTHFFEDEGRDIKQYPTRGRKRGLLIVFSYIAFKNGVETFRKGVDVDCKKLRDVFSDIGFEELSYTNLTKKETLDTLSVLKEMDILRGIESLFIVVSSHGYPHPVHGTEFRCHEGGLISLYDVIEYFNNKKFPSLKNIPKVFIFQVCRGSDEDFIQAPHLTIPGRSVTHDTSLMGAGDEGGGEGGGAQGGARRRPRSYDDSVDRVYSDIIIAHSTLPGFVSHRDESKGSWYIQALCEVFAARAHDCHVEKLFTMVDKKLQDKFWTQTSSVDKWGFNRRLYLYPGLFDDTFTRD